ncbi:MAG TPA: hypothetical protein VL027_11305 [Spongiibacteraceae bacterium]|jgi:hypothetical protein|nr:hypothetical protein [Spongiibacteraceae bacterium]HUH38518.1 hypothetical protein [Spongiibacteraceae bacterium]
MEADCAEVPDVERGNYSALCFSSWGVLGHFFVSIALIPRQSHACRYISFIAQRHFHAGQKLLTRRTTTGAVSGSRFDMVELVL